MVYTSIITQNHIKPLHILSRLILTPLTALLCIILLSLVGIGDLSNQPVALADRQLLGFGNRLARSLFPKCHVEEDVVQILFSGGEEQVVEELLHCRDRHIQLPFLLAFFAVGTDLDRRTELVERIDRSDQAVAIVEIGHELQELSLVHHSVPTPIEYAVATGDRTKKHLAQVQRHLAVAKLLELTELERVNIQPDSGREIDRIDRF